MHQRHSKDFLRTYRRSAGFTQCEISRLMGFENRSNLSRVERGKRIPKLEQALRYEFLFGVPIEKLVPGLCDQVLNGLWEDIETQLGACESAKNPKSKRKCDILRAAKDRIESMSA